MSCIYADSGLFIGVTGKIGHCCLQNTNKMPIPWNFGEYPDLNSWKANQPKLNEIQNSINVGEQPSVCSTCWKYENNNMNSKRTRGRDTLLGVGKIEYVDIRLGNRCNLQCKMCDPYHSDMIGKLAQQLHDSGIPNQPYLSIPNEYDDSWSPEKVSQVLDLVAKLPDLREIMLAGGEPMIMPEVDKLLQDLIDNNHTDIIISIITNCTSAPKRIIEKLKKFKHVNINTSIDATGKYLEFQRAPAKWDNIVRIFDRFQNAGFNIEITPSISMLVLEDIPNLLDFGLSRNTVVSFNVVDYPSYLRYQYVPLENREHVQNYMTTYKSAKNINSNANWQAFAQQGLSEYAEPSQQDCDLLAHYARDVWTSGQPFLELYPWAQYMIDRANDYTPY